MSLSPDPNSDDATHTSPDIGGGIPRRSSELNPPTPPRSPISPITRERRDTESHGPGVRASQLSAAGEIGIGQPPRNRPSTGSGTHGRQTTSTKWNRGSRIPTVIQRERAIEKAALVESAERIYLRYLLPGAEREIYLP